MLQTFRRLLRERLEKKKALLREVDIIQEQYDLLIKDYAEVKSEFEALKWRKLQLQKQIDNISKALEEA